MGVDLTLMPLQWGDHRDDPQPRPSDDLMVSIGHRMNGHNVIGEIPLERRIDLFRAIEQLKSRGAVTVWCHRARDHNGEPRYGRVDADSYGAPLSMVNASDLLHLGSHPEVKNAFLNRAAWAWLRAMPPDHPIVLYWH